MTPNRDALFEVTNRLDRLGIGYALGGSGLLYSLGLIDQVGDWDVLTDADERETVQALSSLKLQHRGHGDYPFATGYKLLITEQGADIEVIGRFAIHAENGVCRLPAIAASRWEGVAVGSAEVWYAAYALMNREEKASTLLTYLRLHGCDRSVVERLLREPLPERVADELSALPAAAGR